jgi:hypothetical protein
MDRSHIGRLALAVAAVAAVAALAPEAQAFEGAFDVSIGPRWALADLPDGVQESRAPVDFALDGRVALQGPFSVAASLSGGSARYASTSDDPAGGPTEATVVDLGLGVGPAIALAFFDGALHFDAAALATLVWLPGEASQPEDQGTDPVTGEERPKVLYSSTDPGAGGRFTGGFGLRAGLAFTPLTFGEKGERKAFGPYVGTRVFLGPADRETGVPLSRVALLFGVCLVFLE